MPRAKRAVVFVGAVLVLTVLGFVIRNQVNVARNRAASEARAQERARIRAELAAELRPVTLSNCDLARIGAPNDGGYLMCANLMAGVESAYSYGIGGEDAWGCAVSRAHKVPVHQYDCFELPSVSCTGAIVRPNAECVGPTPGVIEGRRFDTVANQIARNGDRGRRLVVKMDVEGAEWDTILATPDEVLGAIDQMPMELHGVEEPRVLAVVRKLKTHFHLVAVHFNNMACTADAHPLPAIAYQVLWVNKRVGIPGPPAPGSPTPESLMAPDNPKNPDCQIAR
jgi:hypothetical protein